MAETTKPSRSLVLSEETVLRRSRASVLESVRSLNIWGGGLVDVSILKRMKSLEVLSLSVNSISTLQDLVFCTKLTELYLRKNAIDDLSEIGYIKHLSKLQILWLSDNPCANSAVYRSVVIKALPNLQKLDNKNVSDEERNSIEETKEIQDVLEKINQKAAVVTFAIPSSEGVNKPQIDSQRPIIPPLPLAKVAKNASQAQLPQAQLPQAQIPQAQIPQAQLPQAQLPQAQLPQAQLPQAQLPQSPNAYTSPTQMYSPQFSHRENQQFSRPSFSDRPFAHHSPRDPEFIRPRQSTPRDPIPMPMNNVLIACLSLLEVLDAESLQTVLNKCYDKLNS